MISTLFKRRPRIAAPERPETPSGTVVWAIGDIHGRLDLLQPLVEAIMADAAASAAARKVVIFLGDYVDRGPDSRGVIRYLADLPADLGIEWRFLKGNHEEAMLDFLDDPSAGARWCEYGGDAALRSYGLKPPELKHKVEAWARISADLDHKLTPRERDFLENLELSLSIGDYFFSHAGARPGDPLDRQSDRDLMWIRNSFLDSEVEFEKVVVHGHTPTREVHVDRRRIGVDTKAYDSGVLSAVRLEGAARTIVRAVEGETGVAREVLAA
ncbi:metallophosphoesterase family protein [Brevundimonas sp.]|uniref:metallophosphoesterase family protein n=1 Tax=Brevundimonas sp. TaxID=1871086 RepID=UPI0035AE9BBA